MSINQESLNPQDIYTAAAAGQLDLVREFLTTTPRTPAFELQALFALCKAAQYGHFTVVRYFIEEFFPTRQVTSAHNDALRYAGENGHFKVFRYLIEDSGLDFDLTLDNDYLLRDAIRTGNLQILRYLVEDSQQPINIHACKSVQSYALDAQKSQQVAAYLKRVQPVIQLLGLELFRELSFEDCQRALQISRIGSISAKPRL
jgi:hypothetical protein